MMRLKILYSKVNNSIICLIKNTLLGSYDDVLDVIKSEKLSLFREAYSQRRGQYDASLLLKYLMGMKGESLALWVMKKDLYCRGMNFIFGYAMFGEGAVLSIYRLNSEKLIGKEAVHEIGHVLGLKHCRNRCVMQYSNSLYGGRVKTIVSLYGL